MSCSVKLKIEKASVMSTLMYGCETWSQTRAAIAGTEYTNECAVP